MNHRKRWSTMLETHCGYGSDRFSLRTHHSWYEPIGAETEDWHWKAWGVLSTFRHQGFWIGASPSTVLICSTIAKPPILSLELKTSFRRLYIGSMVKSKKGRLVRLWKIKEPDHNRGTIKVVAPNRNYENINDFSTVIIKSWIVKDSKKKDIKSCHTFKMVFLERNFPTQR